MASTEWTIFVRDTSCFCDNCSFDNASDVPCNGWVKHVFGTIDNLPVLNTSSKGICFENITVGVFVIALYNND